MLSKLNILLFFLTFQVVLSEIVEIDDGKIEGTLLKSRLRRKFFAFFQIPYAQPPVNDLRFQAPRPAQKWTGVLNGTTPGVKCFQASQNQRMSEDCLQLNVFTKSLTASRPVIVFIHGGGFEYGSALDQGFSSL